jgi:hypothetical protein
MRLYFTKTVESTAKALLPYNIDYRKTDYCKDLIRELKSNMTSFIGKTYDSEIFFHESCIYLLVRKELMRRKIKCSQVYDGFYFKKGEMPKDMDEIVKSCAEFYYSHYFIGETTLEKKCEITADMWKEFVEKTQEKPKKARKWDSLPCEFHHIPDTPGEWCQDCIKTKCEYHPSQYEEAFKKMLENKKSDILI